MKGPEMLSPSGVGAFHRLNTLFMSLVDSRSLILCALFFTSYRVMLFPETEHRQGVSGPASKFVDGASHFMTGLQEVNGIDSFFF